MEKIKEKLIERGYKVTKARQILISYFSKKHKPISAQNLARLIKTIDRASVYRTLNIFENLGLLNVEIINKEKLYCFAEKPHHHIICTKCGYIETIKCEHNYKSKNFTKITHQLSLSGLCNKCS